MTFIKIRVSITKMDVLSLRDLEHRLIEDITLAALHDHGTDSGSGTDEIVAQLLLADSNSATTTWCSSSKECSSKNAQNFLKQQLSNKITIFEKKHSIYSLLFVIYIPINEGCSFAKWNEIKV